MSIINLELAKKRNLSESDIQTLEYLHKRLHTILTRPEMIDEDNSIIVKLIESIEYTLQLIWGFSLDKDFHRYWNEVKGCSCAKEDNYDMIGLDIRYIATDCIFHGGIEIEA